MWGIKVTRYKRRKFKEILRRLHPRDRMLFSYPEISIYPAELCRFMKKKKKENKPFFSTKYAFVIKTFRTSSIGGVGSIEPKLTETNRRANIMSGNQSLVGNEETRLRGGCRLHKKFPFRRLGIEFHRPDKSKKFCLPSYFQQTDRDPINLALYFYNQNEEKRKGARERKKTRQTAGIIFRRGAGDASHVFDESLAAIAHVRRVDSYQACIGEGRKSVMAQSAD